MAARKRDGEEVRAREVRHGDVRGDDDGVDGDVFGDESGGARGGERHDACGERQRGSRRVTPQYEAREFGLVHHGAAAHAHLSRVFLLHLEIVVGVVDPSTAPARGW